MARIPRGHVPLAGGEPRTHEPGARRRGRLDGAATIRITVVLRPRGRAVDGRMANVADWAASDNDIAAVTEWLASRELRVVETTPLARSLSAEGSVRAMANAFGVSLQRWEHPGGSYRTRTSQTTIPAHLDGVIVAVLGLDGRPKGRPCSPVVVSGTTYLTPLEQSALYRLPAATGSGQTIGIVLEAGGYRLDYLQQYWTSLGLTPPEVAYVPVGGHTNTPDTSLYTAELMMDIGIAGAVAPGARIVVYDAEQSVGAGFIDAFATAVADTVNRPSVISMSIGYPEGTLPGGYLTTMETALAQAAGLGITVLVASGDRGSSGYGTDGLAHGFYPATSSWVVSCGGTTLTASTDAGAITSEVVWNVGGGESSGGGVSDLVAIPAWQSAYSGPGVIPPSANPGAHVGRAFPDIAANSENVAGINYLGNFQGWGGTSAAAPFYAAAIARLNQLVGYRVGRLALWLYRNPAVCRDITSGTNGAYNAGTGWDACTGLGVIDGAALLAGLYGARLTATVGGGRVSLTLRWPQFQTATLYRVAADGTRTSLGSVTLTGGVWTGSDSAAPVDEQVYYQADDGDLGASSVIGNTVTVTSILVSQEFLDALRGPHRIDVRVIPYRGSTPVVIDGYPDGLPITGGSIRVDATQRIRRQLTCTIGDPGLAPYLVTDLLSGLKGVELYVSRGLIYPDGSTEWCPVGLFHVEEANAYVSGTTEITIQNASDRGGYVADYRLTGVTQSIPGATISSEITRLLGLAIPPGAINTTPIVGGDTTTIAAQMTWTTSARWDAVSQLEDATGVESYFTADGHPRVRPVATLADASVWTVDAGASGVMIEAQRATGRGQTYNGVVARGERTDGTTPVQATVTDDDAASPTYWLGPFGKKPRFYSSPLILTSGQASGVATALLAKVTGWTKKITLTNVVNPALDASQVIQVVYPNGATEKQIIDSMTIPLGPDGSMQIITRTYTPPSET